MIDDNITTSDIKLQKTTESDLETLFEFQLDDEAANMAAFVGENRHDKAAYFTKWKQILNDRLNTVTTILLNDTIVGSISTYELFGETQITYWIGKDFWGKGIATSALQAFLQQVAHRPIYGRVAFDNHGSTKVLTKCGFRKTGTDLYFARTRNKEIEEVIFILE